MILYSPAKINIGLHIIGKRPDGFHNLQSLMYPVGLCDILEIRSAGQGSPALVFSQSGISIPGGSSTNSPAEAKSQMEANSQIGTRNQTEANSQTGNKIQSATNIQTGTSSQTKTYSQTETHSPGGSGTSAGSQPGDKNLCEKAHELFAREREIPPVEIHLHKQIPVGAGLGGGSSNASLTLLGLNRLTPEPLTADKLHDMAATLGSDCPFFLHKDAMMMEGRGEILSPSSVDIGGMYLVLLFPDIHISTPEAYSGVKPKMPAIHLSELLNNPINEWKETIVNDFEEGIFEKHPKIALIKEELYKAGALYASLSGSGSAIFGIFPEKPELPASVAPFVIWKGEA